MVEQFKQLMSIIEMHTVTMKDSVECIKILRERITKMEKEIDNLKVLVNANKIVQ